MRKFLTIFILLLSCATALAQRGDLRRGNREFRSGEYAKADISYRKAIVKDSTIAGARYNLANNLYREQNLDEAAKHLDAACAAAEDPSFAARAHFNRGDVAIAKEDWKTAMDAFGESLRRNPGDMAAKENYIYARNKYQEQQQQGGGDGENDQNEDQQKQNQDQDQNQNQDQQQNQDKEQKQQQQPVELSQQQAQQLLQAIQEKERQTQEKVDEKKAAALKSRQKEKNW